MPGNAYIWDSVKDDKDFIRHSKALGKKWLSQSNVRSWTEPGERKEWIDHRGTRNIKHLSSCICPSNLQNPPPNIQYSNSLWNASNDKDSADSLESLLHIVNELKVQSINYTGTGFCCSFRNRHIVVKYVGSLYWKILQIWWSPLGSLWVQLYKPLCTLHVTTAAGPCSSVVCLWQCQMGRCENAY